MILSVCDTKLNSLKTLVSLNVTFFLAVDKGLLMTRQGGLVQLTEVILTLPGVPSGGIGRTSAQTSSKVCLATPGGATVVLTF